MQYLLGFNVKILYALKDGSQIRCPNLELEMIVIKYNRLESLFFDTKCIHVSCQILRNYSII